MAKRSKKKSQPQEIARTPQSQPVENTPISRLFLLRVMLIIGAGVWIFWPAVHGEWLWDDELLIASNVVVHDPAGLWKIWFEPSQLFDYFPLKVSVEWLEWHLWQDNKFGYHFTNIVLHIVSALLVWRLLSKFGLRLAWLGGLLFLIDPVQVESVAWIAELKNTLSMPPFLLAMCSFIDYENHRRRKDYFLALGFFLVAMLCKTTMVTFPIVILLYIWWKRGRIKSKDLEASAPFFAISLGLGLVTISFLHQHAIGRYSIDLGDFPTRMALIGLSIAFYFSKCFWPVEVLPIYPKWTVNPSSPLQFLPWLVLGGVMYWLWTKRADWGRHVLLGLGFFLITLLPFAGMTAASYMYTTWVMDHILYIPLMGLIGLVVAAMGQIEDRLSRSIRPFAIGGVAVIMALLAWESHGYAGKYATNLLLWSYTIEHNPDAWLAHNNLGFALVQAGHINEGIAQDKEALRLLPDYADAHHNLGHAYFIAGRFDEAIEQDKEALKINPDDDAVHINLGVTLSHAHRLPEAVEQFREVVRIQPNDATAHRNLGTILFQVDQIPEALAECQKAIEINPNDALAHSNLGTILTRDHRPQEALKEFQTAVKIDPNDSSCRQNLGSADLDAGLIQDALAQDEAALKLNSNDASIHRNLGMALFRVNRLPEAIEQFQQALKIDPNDALAKQYLNNPALVSASGGTGDTMEQDEQAVKAKPNDAVAHDKLGVALARANRFPEAIDQFQQALKINPADASMHSDLANALTQIGRTSEAIEQFEQAIKINPNDSQMHISLGNTFAQGGRAPEAIEQYEQAIKLDPNHPEAHNNLGGLYGQMGQVAKAIEQFQQAIKIKPDYIEANNNLGYALSQAGRIPEAIAQYELSLKIDPNNAVARNQLAQLQQSAAAKK
ncbi:tetratricopeptide repeat protein [Methylacidiphilales bacterium]|nr:tetratricopeptide repeat protein [Candidatus Methylacidiphilales bacterium]